MVHTTRPRKIGLLLFILLFIAAGIYHFREAFGFAKMLPEFFPWRLPIIYLTGVVEWIAAILLFVPRIRRKMGIVIAWYLVMIFPANIYAAFAGIPVPGMVESPQWALWVRLLFQPLLIWWVLWATAVPLGKNSGYPLSKDLQSRLRH